MREISGDFPKAEREKVERGTRTTSEREKVDLGSSANVN